MNTPDFKEKIKRLAPSRPDKARPTVRVKGDRGFDPPRAAHSPLPWSYSGITDDNHIMSKPLRASIARVPCDADRVFIVAACNNVERLADACKRFVDYYSGEKALQLGNGQARKSLDEFRAALTQFELDRLQTP